MGLDQFAPIMNLPVALPPDTETVTTVSLWRNDDEGSMLMTTGMARSSADCPAVASVPSDGETGETVPKLNWIAADKEDKFVHYIAIRRFKAILSNPISSNKKCKCPISSIFFFFFFFFFFFWTVRVNPSG